MDNGAHLFIRFLHQSLVVYVNAELFNKQCDWLHVYAKVENFD